MPLAYDTAMFDDADDPDPAHRYRRVTDLLDQGAANPGEVDLLMSEGEPATFAKAELHAAWQAALMDKMASIGANGIGSSVICP